MGSGDERHSGPVMKVAVLVNRGLTALISVLMVALVLIVLSSVFSRYLLNFSLAWSEEVSRFILIWVVLLGAVLAYGRREHLGLDIVVRSVPERFARPMVILADLLISFAAGLMVRGGAKLTAEGMDSLSPALEIPYSYVYVVVPISGLMIGLMTIYDLVRHVRLPRTNGSGNGTVP